MGLCDRVSAVGTLSGPGFTQPDDFWSLCAWSLVTAATAFAQTSHQLLLARAFLGVAESAYLPAAIALIADFHGSKSRGTALGIHLAGLNFGLIAGAPAPAI